MEVRAAPPTVREEVEGRKVPSAADSVVPSSNSASRYTLTRSGPMPRQSTAVTVADSLQAVSSLRSMVPSSRMPVSRSVSRPVARLTRM